MRRVKVLFDHPNPFIFAHGGFQIQIERTIAAVKAVGVEAEHLRWWDDAQTGDLIYYFGRSLPGYITAAQKKGFKVMIAPLLSRMGSRPKPVLAAQRLVFKLCRTFLPTMATAPFGWDSFRLADACIANTAWEAYLMSHMFGAPKEKVHVVPNGIEDVFVQSAAVQRGPWLVCTATITERKRVLELARAAVLAKAPVWIIGKPYSDTDPYAQEFLKLARENSKYVRYDGPIQDRRELAKAYRQARGFVLLSTEETLSLSSFEAVACECPLLLSDLPWARSTFDENVRYCPVTSVSRTAEVLREFYQAAPGLKLPPKPLSWVGIAEKLKEVFQHVLAASAASR